VLTTILLAEAADSTAHSDRASARPQTGHLDTHGAAISQRVRSQRGRLRESTAQSILATFDAPGQAIQSAAAIRADAAAHGIQLRAGIHTGEVDLAGDEIGGISVDIARRVTAHAQPAEILVSRTVKDLLVGSGVSFADRGTHQLGAIPGQWQLFAVTRPQG
jgi:class 3 adenylate cyclase